MVQKFSSTYFSTLLYLLVVKCFIIQVSYNFSFSGRDFIRLETWIGPFCPFRSSAAMDMEKFHSSTVQVWTLPWKYMTRVCNWKNATNGHCSRSRTIVQKVKSWMPFKHYYLHFVIYFKTWFSLFCR